METFDTSQRISRRRRVDRSIMFGMEIRVTNYRERTLPKLLAVVLPCFARDLIRMVTEYVGFGDITIEKEGTIVKYIP